ncbi:MAG: hypothetical protein C0467_14705 [Planctomycetaceae bacterium]|nr:hypothetical protein [Planctomycetaceae bacterium]
MTDQTRRDLEQLVNALVDEQISESDECRLADILRHHPEAITVYREFMDLHAELHWEPATVAVPETEAAQQKPRIKRRKAYSVAIVAASVMILGMAAYWFSGGPAFKDASPIAQVESLSGAVTWTANGLPRSDLTLGGQLPAGTLTLEGESASAQIRFHDGTVLTAVRDVELDILGDEKQKRVTIKRGAVSLNMAPQPVGRPMIIRTPTAEVEVDGKAFGLSVEAAGTQLNVQEGRVKMRRLADGQSIDVSGNESSFASLDCSADFKPKTPQAPPASVRVHFTEPSPPDWKGERLSAAGNDPFRVLAVPCIAGRRPDGTPVIHHAMTVRGQNRQNLVTLRPDSVVSLIIRTESPVPLRIMLSVQQPGGAFGGNFETSVSTKRGEQLPGGWRKVALPLAEFHPLISNYPQPPDDGEVSLVFIASYEFSAKLQVAEVAIEAH